MSKKKKNRNEDTKLKKIVFITVLIQLVSSIIDLITKLTE